MWSRMHSEVSGTRLAQLEENVTLDLEFESHGGCRDYLR